MKLYHISTLTGEFQKFSLSLKNYVNFDANELLDVPLRKYVQPF